MLMLHRRANEAIVINEEIVLTVVEIRGDRVRLGIEAPRDARIHRREIYEAITRASAARLPEPVPPPAATTITSTAPRIPPQPRRVTLAERHEELLERYQAVIREASGDRPDLDRTVELILDVVDEVGSHMELMVAEAARLRTR